MQLRIKKESSPTALEEKITIHIEREDVEKYVRLLTKTWPSTIVERIRNYG